MDTIKKIVVDDFNLLPDKISSKNIITEQKSKKILDSTRSCAICGLDYVEQIFYIQDIKKSIKVPQCKCETLKFEAEQKHREMSYKKTALQKRFENSSLPPLYLAKSLENLDDSDAQKACLKFIKNFKPNTSKGFSFIGYVGRGKTTLQGCVCKELIKNGFNCLFITVSALLDKFMYTLRFDAVETVDSLLYWLCRYDYIVLDDFAREAYTDRRIEFLYRIINAFEQYQKCVSFTANPEKISLLKDKDYKYYADFIAILDRLSALCPYKYIFTGESYRRQNSDESKNE